MQVIPYFYFNGTAEKAINFYSKVFDAKITGIMRFKEQPGVEVPLEVAEKIMHAEIIIGGHSIYISDSDNELKMGENVQVNINCDSEEEIKRFFDGLSEGAKISMPLGKQFWGAIFGALTDQFGISWSLNFQVE